MDRKDMDFARRLARRYISEHHPHGLDASDVENMILRRLHYNKDKVKRGIPVGVLARDMHAVASRQRVRERDRLAVRLTVARLSPEDRRIAELYMELLNWKKVADASKSVFTLSKLTNAKSANNTVFMNLNRKRELGTVFLDLHGDFKGLEVTAILDPKATEEKTDVLHTGEKAVSDASAAAPRRVVWRAGDFLPVAMPMGATGLEFRLGDKEDSLREVRLWFVPDADKIVAAQDKKKK